MKQPAMAAHTNDTSGLGKLLRRAREGRGLTLEQVSNETKIPRRHLQALEEDDASAIPVEFYRRATIRAYARAVRLDQNIVFAELERAQGPPVARESVVERVRARKPTLLPRRVMFAIGVLLAAVVFGRMLVERAPAHEGGTYVASADSLHDEKLNTVETAHPPGAPPQDLALGVETSQPTQVVTPQPAQEVPVAPPLPPSDNLPAAIETTDRASAVSDGDLALTTGEGEKRVSADSATELVVSTQPEGARVTVNGIGWGTAPVTIRYLPAGPKRIRVTREGYATEERTVRLVEGQSMIVDFQLRSAP
jgi:transcriptional regulator with XRE-family HTH domain